VDISWKIINNEQPTESTTGMLECGVEMMAFEDWVDFWVKSIRGELIGGVVRRS